VIAADKWRKVVLVALVAYPAVMIVIATANGPGISADSVSYASAATSFADVGRFVTYDGTALTVFPPGLSATLGVLIAVGLPLSSAAILVNVVAVCVTVAASYFIARQVLASPGWALVASATVSLLAATVRVGSYLWTEALFSALITCALVLITWAVRHGRTPWWLVVAAAVLVALATTVRYVGVVAVPVVVAAIAWVPRDSRVGKAAVAGLIGALGLVLPALRNVLLGSPALGERYPGSVNAEGAITGLVLQWGEYVAPSRTTSLTLIFGVVVGIMLLVGMWLVVVRRNRPGVMLALFVLVYWVSMLVSQVGTRLDLVTERFAAPVLVPSVVLILVAVRSCLAASSRQLVPLVKASHETIRWALAGVLGALGALVIGLSILHAVEFVRDGSREGIGLASTSAVERPLSKAASSLPGGEIVASNDPWQVWWSRRGVVLNFPPSPNEWPRSRIESDLERLTDIARQRGSVVVLLDHDGETTVSGGALRDAGLHASQLKESSGITTFELRAKY